MPLVEDKKLESSVQSADKFLPITENDRKKDKDTENKE